VRWRRRRFNRIARRLRLRLSRCRVYDVDFMTITIGGITFMGKKFEDGYADGEFVSIKRP
jgi:hypothetical protein